jgi:amidophosphoribosyltransferase
MASFEGAYSLVIMSPQKLIAVRDPHGFRPLCFGKTPDGRYVIASESCALDAVGARLEREVDPGEVIVFSPEGVNYIRTHCSEAQPSLCIFEYIYFARPDSVIDKVHVHEARKKAGALLAIEHPVQADVVIGVPDSGIDAAIGYSHQSGIRYDIGLIKNKYIGRSFIVPQQSERESIIKLKLNVVADAVAGKRVVLVDDSIVRGTTMKQLIGMLREAGATEVHVRVSAPPFLNPCFYGTDIDSRRELIAYHATVPEIAQIIGADSLGYLELNHVRYIARGNSPTAGYCTACFSGNYPT